MLILLLWIFRNLLLLLSERDGMSVCIIHLLVSLEVGAVKKYLLLVVQIVFEEAFFVYTVNALLMQARIVTHVLLLLLLALHFIIKT